jgi:hypothetical protein
MTKFFFLLVAAAAAVGLFYFRHQQRAQLDRLQAAKAAVEETAARAEDAEQRSEKFKRALLNLQAEQLLQAAVPTTGTNRSSTKAPEEHPGAKLFRDPEMRTVIKKEHVRAVERNVNRIVDSNLVQLLNLTPEQTASLKDLVQKKHAPGIDLLMGLMSADASELPAIGHAAQRQKKEAEAELRSFLGEQGYEIYAAYEDSLQERERIRKLRSKFEEAGLPISPEQETALLQAMVEERKNFPFTHDFEDPLNLDMDRLPEIFGEASLNQMMNEMEQLNNRIIGRAQGLLDARQSGEFAQALRDHFEQSRMTVKMTQALFPVGGKRNP